MGDSSIRREKDDRQQPLDEEDDWQTAASGRKRMTDSSLWRKKDDWQTAASGGKRMTDSSLWRKKDGSQQHPEGKGRQTAASGRRRI